jgi:hypothetical protein
MGAARFISPWRIARDFFPFAPTRKYIRPARPRGKISLLEREALWVPYVGERINAGGAGANFWSGAVGPPCQ